MSACIDEIIAKCELCGFKVSKPFPSFEIADESRCPNCGYELVGDRLPYPDDLLRPGLRLERVHRKVVTTVLTKASKQGLDSIDIRVKFTNRYETEIEILAIS